MEIHGELKVAEVIAQYAAGRTDFRGLEIGSDGDASFEDINLDGVDFSCSFLEVSSGA